MGQPSERPGVDAQSYLEGELTSPVKHEYLAGEVFAMAGASRIHGIVVSNLVGATVPAMRGGPCMVFAADMKVRVEAADAYYYPDIVVTCEPVDADPYVVHAPRIIVEVLSPSTAAFDRGLKSEHYLTIPSLEALVLVESERGSVHVLTRAPGGVWTLRVLGMDDTLALPGTPEPMPVSVIYDRVVFPPPEPAADPSEDRSRD